MSYEIIEILITDISPKLEILMKYMKNINEIQCIMIHILGSAGINQNLRSKTVIARTMTTKPHRNVEDWHTSINKDNTMRDNLSI